MIEDNAKENETICVIVSVHRNENFIFSQIKKDVTPKIMLNMPSFQGRMMEEPNQYEFYVFKSEKHPYLTQETQLNLELNNYTYFRTHNDFTIYYDKRHFTISEINELKTYKFN